MKNIRVYCSLFASDDEKYPTPFSHEDGSTATLFSSYNPKTVDRHFRWMKEYGIDAAMFDEVDEATAIFKGSNDPPGGESNFITYDGLPSDS